MTVVANATPLIALSILGRLDILRGEAAPSRQFEVEPLDVKSIREKYHLSQAEFATLLGISVKTLRNWDQGRRTPEGPARVRLQVVARHPEAVWDVVRPAPIE